MQQLAHTLQESGRTILIISGSTLGALLMIVWIIKALLYVCPPNHVLIFSGRSRVADDGRKVGFRVVFGGRAMRVPILEEVKAMSLTNISVPMQVTGAYSEGAEGQLGIPLSVHAVANVKVSSDQRFIGNAIERFLGRDRAEIARVAKETLEGHLRGVVAKMTPEEVNEDRLKFARSLGDEAEHDLQKLGLHIDTLKIQHVHDDRQYLESLGRTRIAEVIRAAEVAESDAQRAAQESEAVAKARGDVAMTNAQAMVLRKENELRQIKAELDATARSEEERAIAAASTARAEAEKELQEIRGTLEQLRLAADVTIPADAARQVSELAAAGRAATIEANGVAMANALTLVAEAWRETEGRAMDMFVLQNIESIFGQVAAAARNLKVRHVNLIDSGSGSTLPAYVGAFPATVTELIGEISTALGVDITRIMTGAPSAPTGAPMPPPRRTTTPAELSAKGGTP
ncbi:MAG TPA: SPFH domain-containing protein [Kofleriaceae bacterium]|nr:SPFH domain-containing protein [Kofleriaceae bacterium]